MIAYLFPTVRCVCVVAGDTSVVSGAVVGGSVGGVVALLLLIGIILLAANLVHLRRNKAQQGNYYAQPCVFIVFSQVTVLCSASNYVMLSKITALCSNT